MASILMHSQRAVFCRAREMEGLFVRGAGLDLGSTVCEEGGGSILA